MTALKGFAEAFEEPARTVEPLPRPGTMAHLKWVEEQKHRRAQEVETVDNPQAPDHLSTTETPEEVRQILAKVFPVNEKPHKEPPKSDTVLKSDIVSTPSLPDSATVLKSDTVLPSDTVAVSDRVKITSNWFAQDNDVLDKLPAFQTPAEQVVYRYLYRLAYGWQRQTCFIGLRALSTRCNMGRSATRDALAGLEKKVHIKVVQTFNERDMKGTLYRVMLPCEIPEVGGETTFDRIV